MILQGLDRACKQLQRIAGTPVIGVSRQDGCASAQSDLAPLSQETETQGTCESAQVQGTRDLSFCPRPQPPCEASQSAELSRTQQAYGQKPQAGTEWWSQGQYPQQPRQPHWSYWGGSWAARSSRPESMRYDAVHIDENSWQNGGYPTAPPEEETPDSRRRKAIQKALTNAKKQDQKVRKVRSSLLTNSSNGRFLPSR